MEHQNSGTSEPPTLLFSTEQKLNYQLLLGKKVYAQSWGLFKPLAEKAGYEATFWLEIEDESFRDGEMMRIQSFLHTNAQWQPLFYEVRQGNTASEYTFYADRFEARMYDATLVEGKLEEPFFLLAGNMVPQLAGYVYYLLQSRRLPFENGFFSPEALELIPYQLYLTDSNRLRSSLDEEIWIDDAGWIGKIDFPHKDYRVRRGVEPMPLWNIPKPAKASLEVSPSPKSAVQKKEVELKKKATSIFGHLLLPPEGVSLRAQYLFIGGSGAYDRHGQSAFLNLGYGSITHFLAEEGFVGFISDRRGQGASTLGKDIKEYTIDDRIEDAELALAVLKEQATTSDLPLALIGHSEGGLVALQLAQNPSHQIAGLVLMATPGRPFDQLIEEQIRLQGSLRELSVEHIKQEVKEWQELMQYIRQVPDWQPDQVPPRILAYKHMKNLLQKQIDIDPIRLLAQLDIPVLILQGRHDIQVFEKDALMLYEASRADKRDLQIFDQLNHFFKPGEKTLRGYLANDSPIDAEVLQRLRDFLVEIAKS